MGYWNIQGKAYPPINNPGYCEISSETTDTVVQNILAVVEATWTELQILYRHAICKGKIHSWVYVCSDIHRWGIFQIIPMRYKSEAGTTLDRIKRDGGVAKEIFLYNAPNQTGYNTEVQRVARLEIM